MATYIPISGLVNFEPIRPEDYVALVDSSSMTTYRVPAQAFLDLVAVSGSVISSSYSSASMVSVSSSWASASISSSWSDRSGIAASASWSDSSSLAFSLIGPHTGSTWGTSSWAVSSTFSSHSYVSDTCSFASTASFIGGLGAYAAVAVSASWASASISSSNAITASYAHRAGFATSASWAQNCATAAYVAPITSVGLKAYGAISFWADNGTGVVANSWWIPTVRASYNVSGFTYSGAYVYNPATGKDFRPKAGQSYYIGFSTPMASAAYVVCVTSGGEEGSESIIWTVHPFTKTVNGFYIVRCGGDANNDSKWIESNWLEFAVFQ